MPDPQTAQASPATPAPAPLRVRFAFAPTPGGARCARRRLADTVRRWATPLCDGRRLLAPDTGDGEETAASLELVASELVTNAVRHAGAHTPLVMVDLVLADEVLHLGVTDRGPGTPLTTPTDPHAPRPAHTAPADDDADHGRGVAIVEAVLHAHGGHLAVHRHHDGAKTVWAHLPLTAPDHQDQLAATAA